MKLRLFSKDAPKELRSSAWTHTAKLRKNFIREDGQVDFDDMFNLESIMQGAVNDKEYAKKIKPVKYDYNLLLQCYKKVPKVFRAINTRANFAIQSSYRIVGNESDVKKIERWEKRTHFDTVLIQMVKEGLLFGNCFIQPVGSGTELGLKFLPVETMRIVRENTGKLLGFCQIHVNKIIEKWKPEEMIHFKWNSLGTDAYGIPEIRCILGLLETKLDMEQLIPDIIKYHLEPKVVFRCGTPERPFSSAQISSFKSAIEDRKAGGDLLVPGDIEPIVIQAQRGRGMEPIVLLMNHIESQINTGLILLSEDRMDAATSLLWLDCLERDVKTIQDVLGLIVERQIYTKVLGKDEVPEIIWSPMNIETTLRTSRALRQLVGDNNAPPIISVNEARKEIGYGEMDESELTVGVGREPGGKEVPLPPVQAVDKVKQNKR